MSFNVEVDYRRDRYLSEFSKKTLEDRYMIDGEISPQDAFARAAKAFANNEEHAQKLHISDFGSRTFVRSVNRSLPNPPVPNPPVQHQCRLCC